MISVIIIDDEYLIRERIKCIINWNKLGYEIIGEAGDGEEALELAEKLSPQLALVDIRIPFIDGLEFAKIVKKKYPGIKVVIITGHDKFEYAKEALKFGVLGYILKPVTREELTKTLIDVKEQIEKELDDKNKIRAFQKNIKQRFLQSFLDGSFSNLSKKELDNRIRKYKLKLSYKKFCVLIFRTNNSIKKDINIYEVNIDFNMINKIVGNSISYNFFYDIKQRAVMIINADKIFDKGEKFFEKLRNALEIEYGCRVVIGVGNSYDDIRYIKNSYEEALTAIRSRFIYNSKIINYSSIKHGVNNIVSTTALRERLLINMRIENMSNIVEDINDIFETIIKNKASSDDLIFILYEYVLTINCFKNEIEDFDENIENNINIIDIIDKKENLREIKEWILDNIKFAILNGELHKINKSDKIVRKAKAYIEKEYRNKNLKLDDIAAAVFLNSSHLSSVFKKTIGYSITEYITKCRMEEAKKLLDERNLRLYEIAEYVGYVDPFYLSKRFKRYYGISPTEYLKMKK